MKVRPNTEFLRKRREELGYTQYDVSYMLHQMGVKITDNHYSRIERGVDAYKNPTIQTAYAIAKVLKADIEDCFIFEFEEPQEVPPSKRKKIKHEVKDATKKILGEKLKKLRKEKGIKVQEVAEYLDVHPAYPYCIEEGRGSDETTLRYAKLLGIEEEAREVLGL